MWRSPLRSYPICGEAHPKSSTLQITLQFTTVPPDTKAVLSCHERTQILVTVSSAFENSKPPSTERTEAAVS